MDPFCLPHNRHLDSVSAFLREDPQLRRLAAQPLVHRPALLDLLPRDVPGIHTLGGGRQVGKTTLCKQWMHERLSTTLVRSAATAMAARSTSSSPCLTPADIPLAEDTTAVPVGYLQGSGRPPGTRAPAGGFDSGGGGA